MLEDEDYGVDEDWGKWLLDQYEIDDDFHNVANELGEEGEYQCRQCLTVFSDKSEFAEHIKFHVENYVLDFIRKHQPISARRIHTKLGFGDKAFGNYLDELLQNKKIHYREKHGWALSNFNFK